MAQYKVFTILVVVLLAQGAFTKPIDDSNESFDLEDVRKNATPKQKLFIYAADNFIALGKDYADHVFEAAQKMLKDESFIANHNEEVEEFKKKLTQFVNNYEATKDKCKKWSLVKIYNNDTEHYYDLPESEQTVNSTFIADLLKKYNAREIAVELHKKFLEFSTNFLKMYEESKANLDKPTVEWFENFKTIVDAEKQIDAFDSFWDLDE